MPPIIPDDRADAVLDLCPTFESRRAKVERWDVLGAAACVLLAVVIAWASNAG